MNDVFPEPNNLPENPKLSVCMIVRDEERNLPRCLDSVGPIADELVIVDTGSKDNTVAIARDFGAEVFHFTWCDDFAAARNESLKQAHGDWILQLDADEALVESSVSPLREAMANPRCLLYEIICDNGPNAPNRFFGVHRLYRNHPGIKYQRAYHETVAMSARSIIAAEPSWKELHNHEIIVRHYGYDAFHMKERDKVSREIRIMETYLNRVPDDIYTLTKLGTCYADMGQFAKAIAVSNRALAINSDNAFAHFNMGTVYRKQSMYDEAIREYQAALAIDPSLIGAHTGLGDVYSKKKRFDASIKEYKNALMKMHYPTSRAHYNLGVGYHAAGRLKEAISEYKRALVIDPKDAIAHYNTAVACFMDRQFSLAVMHCDRAADLGFKVDSKFLEVLEPYR